MNRIQQVRRTPKWFTSPARPMAPAGHRSIGFGWFLAGVRPAMLGVAVVGLAAIAGCGEPVPLAERPADAETAGPEALGPDLARAEPTPAESSASARDAAANGTITVSTASWEEIVRSVREAGKPVVLDVWSLHCEPCMREFPGLVELQSTYGSELKCVSANIDFDGRPTHPPESYMPAIEEFLQATQAVTTNYVCATPSDEIYAELDIVSIPAVLVFDAEGKEVARFVDAGETIGFTYDKDVVPAVQELMDDIVAASPAS